LDVAFNSFGALAKLLIDQGIKLWGVSKVVWKDNDRSSYYFTRLWAMDYNSTNC
jgi:hypothetical protein